MDKNILSEKLSDLHLALRVLKKTLNSNLAEDKVYITDCVDTLIEEVAELING